MLRRSIREIIFTLLREVSSGKEMYIPINVQTCKIIVLEVNEVNYWVMLEPTDNGSQYILSTTKELSIPEEKFKIDVIAGTSTRVN